MSSSYNPAQQCVLTDALTTLRLLDCDPSRVASLLKSDTVPARGALARVFKVARAQDKYTKPDVCINQNLPREREEIHGSCDHA